MMEGENISTEHQPKGAARNPSDTLDREGETVESGQRALNDDASAESRERSTDDAAEDAAGRPAPKQ